MGNRATEGTGGRTGIRVLVSGAGGRMGREVVRAITKECDMAVVAAVDPGYAGQSLRSLCGGEAPGIDIDETLEQGTKANPDVVVDFTTPEQVKANVLRSIGLGLRVVWGTTGLSPDDLSEIRQAVKTAGSGAFHAANFAIGAAILMVLSQKIARHMPALEIIELHHDGKKDAPSGTAIRTAEMILEAARLSERPETEKILVEGCRGGRVGPIHIHSVRLPGYVAHQEVIFGGLAQTLTLRHDSIGRESFMPGVVLAIRKVMTMDGLTVGLESLIDLD